VTRFLDLLEEEEKAPGPELPPFSVLQFVEHRGEEDVAAANKFTWNEFQELFATVDGALFQSGRRRRWTLQLIDRCFILLISLTSEVTFDAIAENLRLTRSCIFRVVTSSLTPVTDALGSIIPAKAADVRCTKVFDHFPHVFVIVDASPAFITRPVLNQQQFNCAKFKRHYVKVQALVTADDQCIHLSKPFRGSAHDKPIFDQSRVKEFLLVREAGRLEQFRLIVAELGYRGIQRSGLRAILHFKRAPGQHLAAEQKQHSADLSADRIRIENVFGRWKSRFEIVHGTHRGDLRYLT
jgi:hypothetical protein